MGLIAPLEGFLPQLRSACDAAGTLLIFDEVITGFRLARGGASEWFGVTPDIACFGKVIGGGLPIGAFGGSEEIMSTLAPVGPVYQAGTLSGNPLATAAGCAALQLLDSAAYQKLYAMTERLGAGIEKVLNGAGLPAIAPRVGSLLGLFLGDNAPTQYDEARTTDEKAYARFFHEMLDRGVAMAPGAYEALFVGLAHTEDVVDTVIGAAAESAASL
jgi:glutamate-1-semialdehyde 2,1-aminomutase